VPFENDLPLSILGLVLLGFAFNNSECFSLQPTICWSIHLMSLCATYISTKTTSLREVTFDWSNHIVSLLLQKPTISQSRKWCNNNPQRKPSRSVLITHFSFLFSISLYTEIFYSSSQKIKRKSSNSSVNFSDSAYQTS